ncbi:MAG: hypothetical protein R3313_05370 [Candidatus Saccharimonadales bacterium]|nr:hypothetical protein [Candidatus Saccharimonadales bacterium]
MGNLKTGHLVEAGLWLAFSAFLFAFSFEFDKDIEIYKYGASAWPRAIILLIVLAALGQLAYHWKYGEGEASGMLGAASDDGAEATAEATGHNNLRWYLSTFAILALPFVYVRLPGLLVDGLGIGEAGATIMKIALAGVLLAVYIFMARRNTVGGMLALPLFFAALMEDMGFYALAPFFIVAVMVFMGERRSNWIAGITALIYGLILLLFVKLLYVGLPTGNLHPFYDFGTWVVTILQ